MQSMSLGDKFVLLLICYVVVPLSFQLFGKFKFILFSVLNVLLGLSDIWNNLLRLMEKH